MVQEVLANTWPILVVQTGMQIIAMISLIRRNHVRFENKWIWAAIIVIGGVIGSVAYFYFRGEEVYDEDSSQDY